MKAALRHQYGSPDIISLEEVDKPSPRENEVLIKVHATTVNRTDCANLTGKPFVMKLMLGLTKPRNPFIGTDLAGEVVEVGSKVSKFKPGDRVFAFSDQLLSSQAEYVSCPEDQLQAIPEQINYAEAAASLEGAHYAYTFIHKVQIESGQKVLINGATGAIGSALLQMTRQFDVEITATANTANIELIKSLGADHVIDYTQNDFTDAEEKYDFVFDAVGKSTLGKCKRIMNPQGVYISSELGPYGQNPFFALTRLGGRKVVFPIPYATKVTIPYIIRLLEEEKFKPVIDQTYRLNDISKAYEYALSGQKVGNLIVDITKS